MNTPKRTNNNSLPSLGQWNILKQIGDGASSKVYLGCHQKTQKLAAVKIFDKNPDMTLDIMQNEAQLHKSVTHSNVVSFIEFHDQIEFFDSQRKTTSVSALVMEYTENGDLLELLEKFAPFSETLARTFFYQILATIEHLHSQKITHRDIKPENFLIDSEFNLKLTDFGFAAAFDKKDCFKTPAGTANYISPEILQDKPYSGKSSDLFSAGVTLFMMLVGHCPFGRADPNDAFYQPFCEGRMDDFWKVHVTLAKTAHGKCSLTDDSRDLLTAMLSLNPADRLKIEEIKNHKWFSGPVYHKDKLKRIVEKAFGK